VRRTGVGVSAMSTTEEHLVLWFPLVPRSRPAAGPLTTRIAEIGALARAASTDEGKAATAAEALNKAALIASDCGDVELATHLCWQQYEIFAAAAPLDAKTAEAAVQPLINLGRLLVRAGEPGRAHKVFLAAFAAVDTAATAIVEGRTVDVAALTHSGDNREQLRSFLWRVLLAEGSRALASAGRWADALEWLTRYKGVGNRMLDGRQIAILERRAASDHDAALHLLATSVLVEPWEHAVAATLRATCVPDREAAAQAIDRFLELSTGTDLAVFHTRLGLSTLNLAEAAALDTAETAAKILHTASATTDATVARAVLADQACRKYAQPIQTRHLTQVVDNCSIAPGRLSETLIRKLKSNAETAEGALQRALHRTDRSATRG